MTSANSNYLHQAPPPDSLLEKKLVSIYEFWGDINTQSMTGRKQEIEGFFLSSHMQLHKALLWTTIFHALLNSCPFNTSSHKTLGLILCYSLTKRTRWKLHHVRSEPHLQQALRSSTLSQKCCYLVRKPAQHCGG